MENTTYKRGKGMVRPLSLTERQIYSTGSEIPQNQGLQGLLDVQCSGIDLAVAACF
jgi:hypothetical protein